MSSTARSPRVRLTLIGALDAWGVTRDHLLPRGRKARATLALLGMAAGRPIPRARVAGLLWSRVSPEHARASLRQALQDLGHALAPAGRDILLAGRDEIVLDAEACWVDALEAQRATPQHPDALDLLVRPLLEDMDGLDSAFDAWLAERRKRLSRHGAAVSRTLLDAAPAGLREAAARRLLRFDPTDSTAARLLADELAAAGDRAGAREVLDTLSASLRDAGQGSTGNVPSPPRRRGGREDDGAARAATVPVSPPGRCGIRLGVPPLTLLGSGIEPYLAHGLAEEITAALARFRWLFLGDPAALAAAADPSVAAARMNLDWLLLGSVQRSGARVRVVLRLVDVHAAGEVVWSERFDRDGDDPLALQDAVAAAVVARLDPELLLIEGRRAAARPRVDASAHDLMLRAVPAMHSLDRNGFFEAERLLVEAVRRDADYAASHAWYAWWHLFLVGQGWTDDHPAALARARGLAERATTLDPSDALALTVHGHVLAYLHHRPDEGCVLHDRALALNPNLALAWALSGLASCYTGQHEEALRRLDRYAELAPLHPMGFFLDAAKPVPLMLLGRHGEAAAAARAAAALHPRFSFPLRPWLASLGWLGHREEAAVVLARLLELEPGLTISAALLRAPLRPEDRAAYAEGLRRAGLPEG